MRKAKEKKRRNRPHGGGAPDCKSALSSAIMRSDKTLQQQRKGAVRKYSIHKVPGAHLTFDQRERLAADWNRLVRRGPMPSLRGFAKTHGLAAATWTREFNRGRTGETVPAFAHFSTESFCVSAHFSTENMTCHTHAVVVQIKKVIAVHSFTFVNSGLLPEGFRQASRAMPGRSSAYPSCRT